MVRITLCAVLSLSAACVAELEPETAAITQALPTDCPEWGCGENTPVMSDYKFWELNVNQLPNNANIRVLNFQIGNQTYQPQIINGSQLVAVNSNGTVSGLGLTNGFFNVWTPSGAFKIIVAKVNPKASSNVTFWLGPTTPIETYELNYTGHNVTGGRLCSNPPRSRDSGEGGNRIVVAPLEAILFTGDRYDADQKLVTAATYSSTSGWFNIACAGSVLAKLHLNRHTTAGSTLGWTTSASQRQTLLKMYVSDVCGTGTAWTKAGTPLHWQNAANWSQLNGLEFAFESQWGPNGALCMDTHRLGSLYTAPGNPNDLVASIFDECVPPPCNGSVSAPTFSSTSTVVSAVPFDPN